LVRTSEVGKELPFWHCLFPCFVVEFVRLDNRRIYVPQRVIEKIRDAIRKGNYDMTMHAFEEMAEDNLSIIDVESALLSGMIIEKQKGDPRGTKYVIRGKSYDGKIICHCSGRSKLKCMDTIVNIVMASLESGLWKRKSLNIKRDSLCWKMFLSAYVISVVTGIIIQKF
jgi:hypothetical protein